MLKLHHRDSSKSNGEIAAVNSTPEIRPTGSETRIPTRCVYVSRDIFEVTCTRGKSLASGGFGFITRHGNAEGVQRSTPMKRKRHACEKSFDDGTGVEANKERNDGISPFEPSGRLIRARSTSLTTPVTDYLCLEEVLFLHERGLLECRAWEQGTSKSAPPHLFAEEERVYSIQSDAPLSPVWDSFQLYSMLNQDGSLSLFAFLVYAHLRRQGFRVIRHTPLRRAILEGLAHSQNASRTKGRGEVSNLSTRCRLALREDAANAGAPSLFSLAWDVYEPNSRFKRSNPGLPDLYVAVAPYNSPMSMDRILELVEECDGIMLQIGAVSDSGQVVMLGVHDFAVPSIRRRGAKCTRES